MPGSSKRGASGGQKGRREGARPAPRGSRTRNERNLARRIGWSRRIGVATALVLLIGAGIVFASSALRDPGGSGRNTGPSAPPPPPLTLVAPNPPLTRLATIDISGVLPTGLSPADADALRVFVNGHLERERGVPAEQEFTLRRVAIDEGENEIRGALVSAGGEAELSAPVVVTRDGTPPDISVSFPESGATVYDATEQVRGRTEAGANIELEAERSGEQLATTLSDDGRFEASLPLNMGENGFVLRSEDPAGNRSSTRFVIKRAITLASISLTLSATELALADLPETLTAIARVRDELGRTSNGAEVTFSLSPPNRGTSTYPTITADGQARWPNLIVTGDARAVGTWLVTVLVTLQSGEELRGDASFSVQ